MGGDQLLQQKAPASVCLEQSYNSKEVISSSDESSTSSLASLPTPPDGGWGWVVCGAAFVCMVILDGMMFSFGVMNLELLHFFQESKGRTAMVGSALMGTHLILGPVVSAMINYWDIRKVTMAGGFVAASAFALSTLSPRISILILMYGVLGGVGVSMVYMPSVLAVGFYFEKKRALANGITSSGSGIGVFLYSPLTSVLQNYFGWKGALLILSGLVLNCSPCGALYRSLVVRVSQPVGLSDSTEPPPPPPTSNKFPTSKSDDLHRHVLSKNTKNLDITGDLRSYSMDEINFPQKKVHQPEIHYPSSDEDSDLEDNSLSTGNISSPNRTLLHQESADKRICVSTGNVYPSNNLRVRTVSCSSTRSVAAPLRPLSRNDLYYSGSLMRLPEYRRNPSLRSLATSIRDDKPVWQGRSSLMDKLERLVGISLLKTPVFWLVVAMSVLWTTHSTILTILPHQAVLHGIPESKAAMLLSVIGITNTLGRILAGWITDRPEVDVLWVNIAALLVGGAVCVAIPFTSNYSVLLLQAAIFGTCMATWTSLRPILLVEILGLDKLTNAFGLLAMFQGIAFVIGPPMAGMLYDVTNSYTLPFLSCSAAFITSGLICIPMRRVATYHSKKTNIVNEVNV